MSETSSPSETSTTAATCGWRWWLRAPWDYFAMALGLAYWAVFGLLFTLVSLPLCVLLPKKVGRQLGRGMLNRAFRVFVIYLRLARLVDADLSQLDGLKSREEPLILAPNHTSLWDAVFLISRMPSAICVMKESILKNPFLGGGARLAGYIPNGSSSKMIRDVCQALEEGGQLLLFPEGTRTRHEVRWINPLKGGCAIIAQRSNVPVVPVLIRSNTRFAEKGWPLWRRPVFPLRMEFELGEPQTFHEGETVQEFTARLEAWFVRELSRPHPLRREVVV